MNQVAVALSNSSSRSIELLFVLIHSSVLWSGIHFAVIYY